MAKTNTVFVSFALKDIKHRDRLLEQLKTEQTTFSFVDMPVKQSWEPAWKKDCRAVVEGCDGVIVLVTHHLLRADGQQWEIKCAYDSRLPVLLLQGDAEKLPGKLPEVGEREVEDWEWDTISSFLKRL